MNNKIHIMRLETMINNIENQLVEEKIINTRLNAAPDSIYTGSLYEDIESLQTAIVLLELNDPHFKKEDNENI
tara:strand:- start:854 stop:1072 length:219 start_codon:yes stop_codon:yes gene_type:complete